MPSTTDDPRQPAGDGPGVEARLRAELTAGSLPATVRRRHLQRLHALAQELAVPHGNGNGDGRDASARRQPVRTAPFLALPTAAGNGHGRASVTCRAARRPQRAVAAVAASAVLLMGAGSAVATSATALPGEPLHHVKQAVEQARVALSWSAAREVHAYLAVAEARLDEAARVAAGQGDAGRLPPTLARLEAALAAAADRAGTDEELTAAVEEATAHAAQRLADVLADLPHAAASRARQALDAVVQRLRERALAPAGDELQRPATPGTRPADSADPARPSGREGGPPARPDRGSAPASGPRGQDIPRGQGEAPAGSRPAEGPGDRRPDAAAPAPREPGGPAQPGEAGQAGGHAPSQGQGAGDAGEPADQTRPAEPRSQHRADPDASGGSEHGADQGQPDSRGG